jgi:hypothetical protein
MLTFCPHCGEIRAPEESVCRICGFDFARQPVPSASSLRPILLAAAMVGAIVVLLVGAALLLTKPGGIPPDAVQGRLVGTSGSSVGDEQLALIDASILQGKFTMPNFDLVATTDGSGSFRFEHVPAGRYVIMDVTYHAPTSADDMFVHNSAQQVLVFDKVDGKGLDLGRVVSAAP